MIPRSLRHRRKTPEAQDLRRRQTVAEKIIWKYVRAQKFHGCKFRRQVPIGPYIVDFLCVRLRLVVEIDGDAHWQEGAQEYDKRRDAYLRSWGFRVLRVANKEAIRNPASVLQRIEHFLPSQPPSP